MKLADRHLCSGCAACHDACARSAITMTMDSEGFFYPEIDSSKCVECRRCVAICPALHQDTPRQPLAVYAAKAKDDVLRLASSSGGIFSLLAQQVLAQGGRVYGVAFNQTDWLPYHIGVDDEKGLEALRGSKYVQVCTSGIYQQIKNDLKAGRFVLFSGTPCQIAALRHYLGQDWEQLFLLEVVCHGAPSPLVWKNYLKSRVAILSAENMANISVERIAFRRKDYGWKRFSVSLRFSNDTEYHSVFSKDPFMRAFLGELCNRPSCHRCQFRELKSGADLTLGDFWGIDKFHPEMDDDRGTSLVLVNTDKGATLFERIRQNLDCVVATYEEAIHGNSALFKSPKPHRNRKRFLIKCSSAGFEQNVDQMLKPRLKDRIRRFAGKILRKLGLYS